MDEWITSTFFRFDSPQRQLRKLLVAISRLFYCIAYTAIVRRPTMSTSDGEQLYAQCEGLQEDEITVLEVRSFSPGVTDPIFRANHAHSLPVYLPFPRAVTAQSFTEAWTSPQLDPPDHTSFTHNGQSVHRLPSTFILSACPDDRAASSSPSTHSTSLPPIKLSDHGSAKANLPPSSFAIAR